MNGEVGKIGVCPGLEVDGAEEDKRVSQPDCITVRDSKGRKDHQGCEDRALERSVMRGWSP
jgi:hypothetical protein